MKNLAYKSIFACLCACFCLGADNTDIIHAQKREEILREYEKLELKRQEIDSFTRASKKLFDERQSQLLRWEADLNKTLLEITQKEQNISKMNELSEQKIADMLAKNEQILEQIKSGNKDKMLEVYAKMKEGKVAEVLGAMDDEEAVRILYRLEPKKIAAIMAKIDAQKAATYTDLIKRGAMLENSENNATKSATLADTNTTSN